MKIDNNITSGEIITLCVTVIAIITSGLIAWYSIRENNKNIENTSRAFIFVDKANMKQKPANDGGVIIFIPWKNYGTTPAINVVDSENSAIITKVEVTTHKKSTVTQDSIIDPAKDIDFPDQVDRINNARNILAPGETLTLKYSHLSFSDLKTAFENHQKLYTWAWVEYNDIFSQKRHRTEFCVEMTVNAITPEVDISENICNTFNSFDDYTHIKPKTY